MPQSPPAPLPGPRSVPPAVPSAALSLVPPATAGLAMPGMAYLSNGLGTRDDIERELDGVALAIRSFGLKQPDQVLRESSAYSARLTELCVLLARHESADRQYLRVRTQQVEKYLQELDRQYKLHSRLVEIQRQDLELMKGT